jgi:beta-phosphoglucomutase
MHPIKAIVFDFDGVLANTEALHLRAYQELLAPSGVDLSEEIYCDRYLGFDDDGVFRQISTDYGLMFGDEEIEMLIAEKGRRYEHMIAHGNLLYPTAVPAVRRLAATYPLGIASGSLRHEIEQMLASSGIADRFQFIVSSEDTENTKPAPDPYILAAERHGLPASFCVAIEDSQWGLQSARAAGMRTIALTTTYPRDVLVDHADVVIASLDEVTQDFLKRLHV